MEETSSMSGSFGIERPLSRFVSPFSSLPVIFPHEGSSGTVLGTGVCFVLGVHRDVAFKFAQRFEYMGSADEKTRAADNVDTQRGDFALKWEAHVYGELTRKLRTHPTIHILNPYLHVPEGIFLPRQRSSLHSRLLEQGHTMAPIPLNLKIRWADQLVAAAAWLEEAGYFHGDLRPANILLDRFDNVILADFGSSDHLKSYLRSSANVFCPNEFVSGSRLSEQYALAWCLYNIFHGSVPEEFDVSDPSKVVFPPVQHLCFGTIINDAWHLRFSSLSLMRECSRRQYVTVQPFLSRFKDKLIELIGRIDHHLRSKYLVRKMKVLYTELSRQSSK